MFWLLLSSTQRPARATGCGIDIWEQGSALSYARASEAFGVLRSGFWTSGDLSATRPEARTGFGIGLLLLTSAVGADAERGWDLGLGFGFWVLLTSAVRHCRDGPCDLGFGFWEQPISGFAGRRRELLSGIVFWFCFLTSD